MWSIVEKSQAECVEAIRSVVRKKDQTERYATALGMIAAFTAQTPEGVDIGRFAQGLSMAALYPENFKSVEARLGETNAY